MALEAGRSGADVVVVNPTTPVGERDIKPTPTGRIIVDFLLLRILSSDVMCHYQIVIVLITAVVEVPQEHAHLLQ